MLVLSALERVACGPKRTLDLEVMTSSFADNFRKGKLIDTPGLDSTGHKDSQTCQELLNVANQRLEALETGKQGLYDKLQSVDAPYDS